MPLAVENTVHVMSAAMAMDPGMLRAASCSDENSRVTMFARSTT